MRFKANFYFSKCFEFKLEAIDFSIQPIFKFKQYKDASTINVGITGKLECAFERFLILKG